MPISDPSRNLVERYKAHWPLLVVLLAAAVLLFVSLGKEHLWADEGDTAVFASRILQTGLPAAWDGVTFIDSDMGARLNKDLIMVSHPWVQYYLTAASFLFFGETPFAARFPFAVAGWLTILLTYCLVFRLTKSRQAASTGAVLLLLSVQFLLYARQSRNYSLTMFFTCWLLLRFFQLTTGRGCLWFTILAALAFHTHPIVMAVFGALGILTLFYRPFFIYRKWFWISMIPISFVTVPWLVLARTGLDTNTTVSLDIRVLFPRLVQFLIEYASVTPVIGFLVLLAWTIARIRNARKTEPRGRNKKTQPPSWDLEPGERNLLVLVSAVVVSLIGLSVVTQSRGEMWSIGMRYASPLIPLIFAATGFLISKLSGNNRKVWVLLFLIFAFTKLGQITPWAFGEKKAQFGRNDTVLLHIPRSLADRFLCTSQIAFLRESWSSNPGSVTRICEFLNKHAARDEILITNYEWEPIYFHTKLPQGLKVYPESPTGEIAIRRGLPEYVYTVSNVSWIVWRPPWTEYCGYFLEPILNEVHALGATVKRVATLPETIWENRENLHFHRFPGDDYKYPWYDYMGDVQIFRVEWQNKNGVAARD